jgi:hypothetical protein
VLLDEEPFQLDPTERNKIDKHQAAIRLAPPVEELEWLSRASPLGGREKSHRQEIAFIGEELRRIGCLAAFFRRIAACANQFSLTLRCLNPSALGFHPP